MSDAKPTKEPGTQNPSYDIGGESVVLAVVDSALVKRLFERGILTGSEGASLLLADVSAVRGVQGFIDAKKAEVQTKPLRRQHREASFDVAHTFFRGLTEEDYEKMRLYQARNGKPFCQHLKAAGNGDITLFPFIEVAPGQELALRRIHSNNPDVDDIGFQLAVKVEGIGEIDDGSPFPEPINTGVTYATISDKDGSLIGYADEGINTNALLAEASDREVTAKLQLVTEGLRNLIDGIQ